ncbi:MAG: hypothetical protein ETSY1_04460 [Candidatus Entotheonella factor]|uniref:PIN domain-containing protein n=1 Tax=Entotheonella factor TaxID=1429438 RepID=W4LWB5_ENTF1|nr:MAG: hypothetical protein ETSY1_04460 [Candidatus Entotheonella factor]
MSDICIVDTSVLCNLLRVPNRDQQYAKALSELDLYIDQGHSLLLPLATIYETGNHIAQNGNGQQRRKTAERFVDQVRQAVRGENPFRPTQTHQVEEVLEWLQMFPDRAMHGVGLADLTIIQIFHQQCQLNRVRQVFIWSYDQHLSGYNRSP